MVGWDTALKRLDHADFFSRACGVLVTVFNREMKCLHAPEPFDHHYMAFRNDYAADRELIGQRYYSDRK